MDDSLLNYYEQELSYVRQTGAEFARKYPKIAGRLLLEHDRSTDPHTERLIEAFAFISGRIHKKIDDDFPAITESLFSIIYPHYNNPIPSLTIVRFDPIMQNITEVGYLLERGTKLYSKPVNGTPCQFTTCHPVQIWPVEVKAAGFKDPKVLKKGAQQAIHIQLKTTSNIPLSELGWKSLRFFLHGQHEHVFSLYELLFNNVCHVECEAATKQGPVQTISLGPSSLTPVGFEDDEGVLPFSKRSFPGYRLLFEYFSFPEKFLFFDLQGLEKLKGLKNSDTLDIWIYLNRVAKSNVVVNAETFCLNAAPAVNLFSKTAEPIRVEQRKTEYLILPDIRRQDAMEIYSVDRVTASTGARQGQQYDYRPFYSIRHHLREDDEQSRQAFWHIQRRQSERKGDKGTDVYLSFTDLDFQATDPGVEILTLHTTCTNRDLPSRLPLGSPNGDFDLEVAAPLAKVVGILKATPARRPSLGGALHWRLISHLSLNYLSIVQGGEEALREILRLYDFDNSPATRQQIDGINRLTSRYVTKRMGRSLGRGVQVMLEFDEDKYVGTGIFLFASILERFLGQYVSVNSFSQMVARTIQKKEVLREWPPRSGNRILL
ncbi:MAG: type VI secretion system baseplate subunit TssF [Deltaproteobacteria bacterium]|nr:type VI secretion system baseplate subunit TssF [Deltaproteobacteria bacterium]